MDISASATWHYCHDDPCLGWLGLYGEQRGFVPDTKLPKYDERTDFSAFVMRKGREFESRDGAAQRHRVLKEAGMMLNRAVGLNQDRSFA